MTATVHDLDERRPPAWAWRCTAAGCGSHVQAADFRTAQLDACGHQLAVHADGMRA